MTMDPLDPSLELRHTNDSKRLHLSSDYRWLLAIGAVWIAAVLLVDPRGDFPITDDWAYAYSVRALHAGRGIVFSDWTATNLFTQLFWGWLFTAGRAVTYDGLRWSMLVAGLVGGLATFRTVRLAGGDRWMALFATAATIANPIYFNLSFSFMTDVFYTALQMSALCLLLDTPGRWRSRQIAGWAIALAALLVRQTAISIPLGLAVATLMTRRWSIGTMLTALLPIVSFEGVQKIYEYWLKGTGRAPALFGRQIDDILISLHAGPLSEMALIGRGVILLLLYLGLFMLPVTLYLLSRQSFFLRKWEWKSKNSLFALTSTLFLAVGVVKMRRLFPMWGGQLDATGLATFCNQLTPDLWFRAAMTLLSLIAAILLLIVLGNAVMQARTRLNEQSAFAALAAAGVAAALILPILLIAWRFDRYVLPVVPCLAAGLAIVVRPSMRALSPRAGLSAMGSLMTASLVLAHDFMAVKRVQAQAYYTLISHVPARRVDGSWVMNGATRFEQLGRPRTTEHWFDSADWIVTSTDRASPGYRIVARRQVRRWLDWGRGDQFPVVIEQRR